MQVRANTFLGGSFEMLGNDWGHSDGKWYYAVGTYLK